MMRCTFVFLLLISLSAVADPMFAQDSDGARQKKRLAEIEKEIKVLKARLENLNAELYKLKEAVQPNFKNEYMKSPEAKALRGKWQAVRIAEGGHIVAAESLAKVQLEISDNGYYSSGMRVKWLEGGKKAYEAELPEMNGIWGIDPTTAPKTISFWRERQNLAERFPWYGIYKLEGDTLTVGWGGFASAPPDFDAKNITIYKRLKDEPKKPAK